MVLQMGGREYLHYRSKNAQNLKNFSNCTLRLKMFVQKHTYIYLDIEPRWMKINCSVKNNIIKHLNIIVYQYAIRTILYCCHRPL